MTSIMMGIDPSSSSTGICVWDQEHDNYRYYLIVKNPTNKIKKFVHPLIKIISFEEETQKNKNSVEKEIIKSNNSFIVTSWCDKLISFYKPSHVVIEAIAMHGVGRIDHLSGINYGIRMSAIANNSSIIPVSPTSNKMEFVGNGGATKEMMIEAWKGVRKEASEFKPLGKHLADLADAYSLVHFPINKYLMPKTP